MREELSLPPQILNEADIRGNEYAWKLSCIPLVAQAARDENLGILGGQVQVRFPDATCEFYWLNADPAPRKLGESWNTYVNRSYFEFIELYNKIILTADMNIEARHFDYLGKKIKDNLQIADYTFFVLYFINGESK